MNDRKNAQQRGRTGTFEVRKHADGTLAYWVRLRLADGTKSPRMKVPAGFDEAGARAWMLVQQTQEETDGLVLKSIAEGKRVRAAKMMKAAPSETADDWFRRYMAGKTCGEGYRRISSFVWGKWVSPTLGPTPVAKLTRDQIEDVRDALDRAIEAKAIRSATALNAWTVLVSALKAASAAKDRSLRVHSTALHLGILPPKRGLGRQRPWLFPREWLKVVSSAAVPIEYRRTYAIALYTGLRPGELRALTWADVDLDARTITVSKAIDPETNTPKSTKTAEGMRIVPIHPNLAPLLGAAGSRASELVVALLSTGDTYRLAQTFRSHLALAGVDRPRLTADTETEEGVDFRSLRDTNATWQALAGTSATIIKRRMGHKSADTTDGYIKVAESFDQEGVGEPFPPLPRSLWTNAWPTNGADLNHSVTLAVGAVGLEPTTSTV